jgi:general secretion pathway protein A
MLEELRMLTNLNTGSDLLLQLILAGQPELRDLITRPSLRQFAQRVSATFHINPFELDDTAAYIRHRLRVAGGTGQEFSTGAIEAVYEVSGGIPRMINKLCDLALVYAASGEQSLVEPEHVQEVMDDGLILISNKAPLELTNRVDLPAKVAK